MCHEAQSCLLRDVSKTAMTVVLEERVASPHRGHKQILIPIVIDVRECRRDANPSFECDSRFWCNVPELPRA